MTQLEADRPPVPTSPTRRLLAVYVDYLLFTAVFYPVAWLLESAGVPRASFVARIAIFTGLRIGLSRLLNATPGQWALGMVSHGALVDADVKQREVWWTLLAGILLVLEGSKNLVRWTQGLPPPPLFVADLPDGLVFAGISLVGAANLTAGVLILRARPAGALLGVAVLLCELVATLTNGSAFREWAAQSLVVRRSLQGRPLREGEVEFMQAVVGNGLALGLVTSVVVLLLVYNRFCRWRPA